MPTIGRHMPLESHPLQALKTAKAIGCDAIQIFVSSPRTWAPPADNPKEVARLAEGLRAEGLAPIVIHAPYLVNLASGAEEIRQKSRRLLRWTLERGIAIGASEVVIHIGSHGGAGHEVGAARLVEGVREVLADLPPGPRLLLENDVGAGNTIGSRFDALAEVLAELDEAYGKRLGICLDTAHLWGAGYDIGSAATAQTTLDLIDQTVGLRRVTVVHLNDTATTLGKHLDRHARLGEGIIGTEGLQVLLRDERLAQTAIILETPIKKREDDTHDWDHDRTQVQRARELAGMIQPGVSLT